MSGKNDVLGRYDSMIAEKSRNAVIVSKLRLFAVEGEGEPVCPPTYASVEKDGPPRYNINTCGGKKTCTVDSVQSQANRMAQIFGAPKYNRLVPKVTLKLKGEEREETYDMNTDIPHGVADGAIIASDLGPVAAEACRSFASGDAVPLVKFGPLSVTGGFWNGRGNHEKQQRLIRARIDAHDVEVLYTSSQYTSLPYDRIGALDPSQCGKNTQFAQVPSRTLGGVVPHGEIRRTVTISLEDIRKLRAGDDGETTRRLRRYVLGLILVMAFNEQSYNLRQGCFLVPEFGVEMTCELVSYDGLREAIRVSPEEALEFALAASEDFGVGEDIEGTFCPKMAAKLNKDMKDKKDKKGK